MSEIELLNCPFCGSRAAIVTVPGGRQYFVQCSKRGSCFGRVQPVYGEHGFTYREDAIRLWNTRTDHIDKVAKVFQDTMNKHGKGLVEKKV